MAAIVPAPSWRTGHTGRSGAGYSLPVYSQNQTTWPRHISVPSGVASHRLPQDSSQLPGQRSRWENTAQKASSGTCGNGSKDFLLVLTPHAATGRGCYSGRESAPPQQQERSFSRERHIKENFGYHLETKKAASKKRGWWLAGRRLTVTLSCVFTDLFSLSVFIVVTDGGARSIYDAGSGSPRCGRHPLTAAAN